MCALGWTGAAAGSSMAPMPAAASPRKPACAAALAAAVLALAAPQAAPAQVGASVDYLARMDSDGDGRVSLAEYQHWMGYAFERMDRDRNGRLDPAELPGGRGRPLDLAEHRERLAAGFRRQDRNGDGMLDAAELAAPPAR